VHGSQSPPEAFLLQNQKKMKNLTTRSLVAHWVTAFGGGVLVAAVAFVLAPRAVENLSPLLLAFSFLAGGGCLFFLDRSVERAGGRVAQLVSMLMNYLPEALSLGTLFARHHDIAHVLVIFIGLQNLPEAFNAHDDLIESGMTTKRSYLISHMPDKWIPALGATIGFIFGMMGEKLIG